MNHNFKDETGKRYGNLTVIALDHVKNKAFWLCKCECGNTKVVSGDKLRSGNTKSCGCIQDKVRKSGNNRRTHGMTHSRLYSEWCNMRSRCNYPGNVMYKNYGGRGIRCCEEWNSFDAFMKWANESGYTDDLTLERIDINKGYNPDNCSWIPRNKQYLNRSDIHYLTAFGKTQTIKEWSEETGIKYDTIHARIKYYGWDAEKALSKHPKS